MTPALRQALPLGGLTIAFAAAAMRATAQPAPDPATAAAPAHGLEVWAGISPHSSRWGVLGATPDVRLALGAVRLWRELGHRADTTPNTAPSHTWRYTVDLIPIALLSPPFVSTPGAPGCPARAVCAARPAGESASLLSRQSVYGAGVSPLGLTSIWRAAPRVQLSAGGSGGFLWTTQPVPTTRAGRFNFTAALDAGVRVLPRGGPELALLYRFHHLSNAATARENPAVASHLFCLSVGWQRATRSDASGPAR